jgi:hypothetical protein
MSEDRFEQEEPKDEDVEAHKKKQLNVEATDELGSDESDDVEAHRKHHGATEEPASDDDSDDFEAHRKRA